LQAAQPSQAAQAAPVTCNDDSPPGLRAANFH
jgi:hypothetical protein